MAQRHDPQGARRAGIRRAAAFGRHRPRRARQAHRSGRVRGERGDEARPYERHDGARLEPGRPDRRTDREPGRCQGLHRRPGRGGRNDRDGPLQRPARMSAPLDLPRAEPEGHGPAPLRQDRQALRGYEPRGGPHGGRHFGVGPLQGARDRHEQRPRRRRPLRARTRGNDPRRRVGGALFLGQVHQAGSEEDAGGQRRPGRPPRQQLRHAPDRAGRSRRQAGRRGDRRHELQHLESHRCDGRRHVGQRRCDHPHGRHRLQRAGGQIHRGALLVHRPHRGLSGGERNGGAHAQCTGRAQGNHYAQGVRLGFAATPHRHTCRKKVHPLRMNFFISPTATPKASKRNAAATAT